MNQSQLGSFESIALTAIRPSATNPRKTFDQVALDELTRSVEEMGVTQPLLLRLKSTSSFFVKPSELMPEDGVVIYVCHPKGDLSIEEAKTTGRYNIIETFSTGTREENLHWASAEVIKRGKTHYEIVSGERRFRAAQAAGLTAVPAIVAELSDDEALNIQMIENLQRADLHPVEEAEGYRALMATGASAEDVAKKAGKKLAYVQQRIALLKLEVDAKKLFADGHLTLDHALLLARLTPKDQERALRYMLRLEGDYTKTPIADAIAQRLRNHKSYTPHARVTSSTSAELRNWINDNVLLQLKGVPWDLGDAELLPIAGPCTTCPKRAGANAALFSDITTVEDTCTDPACFGDKQTAQRERQLKFARDIGTPLLKLSSKRSSEKLPAPVVELKPGPLAGPAGAKKETTKAVVVAKKAVKEGQWVEAKKGECPATVQGIYTDGPKTGQTRYACADQACKVHKHQVDTPRNVQPTAAGSGAVKQSAAEQEFENAKHAWEEKRDRFVKAKILTMVYETGTADETAVARRLITSLWEEVEYEVDKDLLGEVMGMKPTKHRTSIRPTMAGAIETFIEKQPSGELLDLAAVLYVAGESYADPLDVAKRSGAGAPKTLVKDFELEFADENPMPKPAEPSGIKVATTGTGKSTAKKSPAKKASPKRPTSGTPATSGPVIDGKSAAAGATVEARS